MSCGSEFLTNRNLLDDALRRLGTETLGSFAGILEAASELSGKGQTLILTGGERSCKTSMILNMMEDNYPDSGRIARNIIKFKIENLIGAMKRNIAFLATDDERIPHEALIIHASAARPCRALLDDDNVFFSRIFYDLLRYFATNTKECIGDVQSETVSASIKKSLEYYLSSGGKNCDCLASWLDEGEPLLIERLCAAVLDAIKDATFRAAVKILFKNSETERNNKLMNSECSFSVFAKGCVRDDAVTEKFAGMWNVIIEVLNARLDKFQKISKCPGMFFLENKETIELIIVTADKDGLGTPTLGINNTALEYLNEFVFRNVRTTGNNRAAENYFSKIEYIFRVDPRLCEAMNERFDLKCIEVSEHNGKPVHALRFVELGSSEGDTTNRTDEAAKRYSAAGMLVFGEEEQYLISPSSFDNIFEVMRTANYELPTVLVKTKMDSRIKFRLGDYHKSFGNIKVSDLKKSEENFSSVAYQKDFPEYEIFRQAQKNRAKQHPVICGAFSAGTVTDEETDDIFKKVNIRDFSSREFISDVIACVINNSKLRPAIAVKSEAFKLDFARFTADEIRVTPNIFTTLCSCFGECGSIDPTAEGCVVGCWLNAGEKFDSKDVSLNVPNAAFINSIRNFHRTYLQKFLVISEEAVAAATESTKELTGLLENAVRYGFGTFLAKKTGEYCYRESGVGKTLKLNADSRFSAVLRVLSRDIFPDDEILITKGDILHRLLAEAFNDCVYDAIARNCKIIY